MEKKGIILKYGTNHDENLLELYGNIKEFTLGVKGITFIFATKKCSLLILNVLCINQIFITMLDFEYYRIKHKFQYL
jgi:hypothetical protein